MKQSPGPRGGRTGRFLFRFRSSRFRPILSDAREFPRDKISNPSKATPEIERMISPLHPLCALSLCLPMLMVGCSTTTPGSVTITKVNPYHLSSNRSPKTEDEMISFEASRYTHGVYVSEEVRERFGNYFTIFWKTKTRQPATIRLEFRTGNTGSTLHQKETVVAHPKHRNVTKFQVTGSEYESLGKVTQWKASVVENGLVVAEYKSFLWNS